jgi:hypothetical protein
VSYLMLFAYRLSNLSSLFTDQYPVIFFYLEITTTLTYSGSAFYRIYFIFY